MRALAVPALRVSGITDGAVALRMPTADDVDGLLIALSDLELREAGNPPAMHRDQALATPAELPALAACGRMLPLIAVDARTGRIVGGGTLHHLDAERSIVEIGYRVLPEARRRPVATRIARQPADHAFARGMERVAAYVNE